MNSHVGASNGPVCFSTCQMFRSALGCVPPRSCWKVGFCWGTYGAMQCAEPRNILVSYGMLRSVLTCFKLDAGFASQVFSFLLASSPETGHRTFHVARLPTEAFPEFKCCAGFHPSNEGFCKATKEDDLEVCRKIKCPQLLTCKQLTFKSFCVSL